MVIAFGGAVVADTGAVADLGELHFLGEEELVGVGDAVAGHRLIRSGNAFQKAVGFELLFKVDLRLQVELFAEFFRKQMIGCSYVVVAVLRYVLYDPVDIKTQRVHVNENIRIDFYLFLSLYQIDKNNRCLKI